MNKNTCWFFGDSFTNGDGCKPEDSYYKKYPNGKLWTTRVSNHFEMNEKNISRGGCSNQYILNNIILNLPNIDEKDIVILSDTIPTRTLWYDDTNEQRHSIIEESESVFHNNQDKVILNYITEQLLPHEKEWENFYLKQYESLLNELQLRNVKVLFWSYKLWYPPNNTFQTIWDDTEGDIDNGHWSWLGHKQMSEYIIGKML